MPVRHRNEGLREHDHLGHRHNGMVLPRKVTGHLEREMGEAVIPCPAFESRAKTLPSLCQEAAP